MFLKSVETIFWLFDSHLRRMSMTREALLKQSVVALRTILQERKVCIVSSRARAVCVCVCVCVRVCVCVLLLLLLLLLYV